MAMQIGLAAPCLTQKSPNSRTMRIADAAAAVAAPKCTHAQLQAAAAAACALVFIQTSHPSQIR